MDYMDILKNFKLSVSNADIYSESTLTGGHINGTTLISLPSGKFILQTINQSVFSDLNILENNLYEIKRCFKENVSDTVAKIVSIPDYMETDSGNLFFTNNNSAYRLYKYIDQYDAKDITVDDRIRISAFAFGKYINLINGCELKVTLPGYHDMDHYSKLLNNAIIDNPLDDISRGLVDKLKNLEQTVKEIFPSSLPMRNIHGDASVKNIIITDNSGASVIIDLDTSFPGYAAYDYGDLVRSSLDLIRKTTGKKVLTDSRIIRIIQDITSEYLRGTGKILTEKEIHSLIPGMIRVDCELAMRYLTDAISQSYYFEKTPAECIERASDLICDAQRIIRLKDQLSEFPSRPST